ncbi:MAG: FHA domain-containing protein [Nitriliruptorales bacterium]|nr:FHA domain-containing protein [Nitriliruptorales bacterium]
MAPILLTLLQGMFLLLLYLFVWRVARTIIRDLRSTSPPPRPSAAAAAAQRPSGRQPRSGGQSKGGRQSRGQPRELVIHRSGAPPRVLALDGPEVSFGRSSPSTVVLDDPYVSDRHARIWHDGSSGWVVSDLGSTNGTFLNQVKVTRPTPIAAGDQLGIGKTTVEVRR